MLQTMFALSAQTRLHTIGALDLTFSNTRNLIVNTVFDKEHTMNPGFINDFNSIPHYGFYIDEEANLIIYTTYELNQECDRIERYERKTLEISAANAKSLANLLHIVTVTSSPQQEHIEDRDRTSYYKYGSIIAEDEFYVDSSSIADLLKICRTVCKACETNDESLIDSMKGQIKELTGIYKNLLNYDFNCYWSMSMTIGYLCSYVYVIANFDQRVKQEDMHKYEMVLDGIAHYLVKNNNGPVDCYIDVRSSIKKGGGYILDNNLEYIIVVGIDDFTADSMIHYCNDFLKKFPQ